MRFHRVPAPVAGPAKAADDDKIMEMASEQRIPAPREKVWAALNDPAILQAAMPGCESFEAVGDNQFSARVTTKVGPVKARFTFQVNLTAVDPPNGYTINGEGQGGAAGFAKGSADVGLEADGSDTLLRYKVSANVGGKLAQLGARLIDGTARKLADEFFGNFIALVSPHQQSAEEEKASSAANTERVESAGVSRSGWIYVAVAAVIAAVVFSLFR